MEKRFESLSLFEFQQKFPDDQVCMDYLAGLKWPEGFVCEKCSHPDTARESYLRADNVLLVVIKLHLPAARFFTRSNSHC